MSETTETFELHIGIHRYTAAMANGFSYGVQKLGLLSAVLTLTLLSRSNG